MKLKLAIILAAGTSAFADGLDSLSDDVLLADLARRGQTAMLERAFELNRTPAEKRDGIRAMAALARLQTDVRRMLPAERQATVAKIVAGINVILPTLNEPGLLMEQVDVLLGAGIALDVNTLEYWGPSASTQAQLRPTVETAIKMLDRADTLASERAARFAETANPNVPKEMARVEAMESLSQVAQQTRALANYYLALCFDGSDPRRAQAANAAIDFLDGFDVEGNPARNNLKLVLGKLHAAKGEFDKARAAFDFVIAADAPAPDAAAAAQQRAQQFEARYFRTVVEVQAKAAQAARAQQAQLLAWQQANPSNDPSIATANTLLEYRILAIEPGEASRAQATALLINLLERRPDLEGQVMSQLRASIGKETPVTRLEPLLLRALITDAQEQVVRQQQDASYKPEAAVLSRGLDAANELVARRGQAGIDPRMVSDAQFLAAVFLEALDRKPEAASRYLDFAEGNRANVEAATAALSNAQRLFAQQGGLRSEDEAVTRLYDRILPLALAAPFNQKELAYDWAFRLQQTDRPAEAVDWYRRVERDHPRYAAARYYLMVALSQTLDKLQAGNAQRAAIAAEIQTLADEVRTQAAAAMPTADDAAKRTLQQRLARTALLAAAVARSEQNDPRRALELVDGAETTFAGLPDAQELVGEAMFTRIQANMQLGNTDAAVRDVVQLLERSGGAQGAQIVFNMLSKLERDFSQAEAAEDREKMARLQANRAALTPYLVTWADKNLSGESRKFTYSYRVYDAETQRLAAELERDPEVRKQKRQQALRLFEGLDTPAAREQFRASRAEEGPVKTAYDPQVAIGVARIYFDGEEWTRARDAYARLLADRAVGTAVATIREAGQEKQVDNDAYWEATLRLIRSKVKAGDDVEPLKILLREQLIRWGERVGGTKWKGEFATLRQELIPDFDPASPLGNR